MRMDYGGKDNLYQTDGMIHYSINQNASLSSHKSRKKSKDKS